MKQSLRCLLSVLLCLCMLAGTFIGLTSCNIFGGNTAETDIEGKTESQAETDGETETDGKSETESAVIEHELKLASGGKTDYIIIVPTDNELFTEEIFSAVNSLRGAFEDYTGAKLEYTEDFIRGGGEPDDAAYEILIGETNRKQSADAIAGMRTSEYVVKADGNKLVINGVGTKAIVAAINYFITNMIKDNSALSYGGTGELIFKTENDYYKRSQYPIKSIKLCGEDISSCQIVYPDGGYVEEYIATLLKMHIATYSGITVEVVSDSKANASKSVLVGKTKYTTVEPDDGRYNIEVTNKGLEIVVGDIFTYVSVYTTLQTEIFKYSESDIDLQSGQKWSGVSMAPDNLTNDSDIRIMYHNVWGYLNANQETDPNPIATRFKVATAVYEEYMPDVIGFQEMSTGRRDIEGWLTANGYAEKVYCSGNPIWYNTNTLECLDSGYVKAEGNYYYSIWCILKVKATGKVFGMTNSHFTADSMPGDGNAARIADAQALLGCVAAIKASEHGGEGIPIFTGGDYNTKTYNPPYSVLVSGGLTNARDVAAVSAQNSCYHTVVYDKNYEVYLLPLAPSASAAEAIDHIMIGGNKNAVTVDEYAVISDSITASTSDHAPHFIDVSFK